MAYATPRRPSAIPELASPSPSFTRRVSTASSLGGGGQSGSPSLGSGSERKRRTRLRDYYGLSTPRPGDGMDLDSPASFDANNYFQTLASTASLPELLKRETDLINEIRELDGERQSLVYNHHGELISASDTIRKANEEPCRGSRHVPRLAEDVVPVDRTTIRLACPDNSIFHSRQTASLRSAIP
ncbi:Vacuolar protein sorting-associated protein 51-like protein [Rhodotorula toruloides]|nr:Vacuolar protein sorting-associated protein 51-like protein [Rhodotorula toruloides]